MKTTNNKKNIKASSNKKNLKNFYNKYLRFSVMELTVSAIFFALYLLFGVFSIKIAGVMRISLDFVILGFMGMILGPFRGVFLCLISDLILQLIQGIGY